MNMIVGQGILAQIQHSNAIHYNTLSRSHLQNAMNHLTRKYHRTDKRILAHKRNWNKFRLMGFGLDEEGLTQEEKDLYNDFKSLMLDKWDERTGQLGLVPRKAIKEQKERIKNLNNQQ